MWLMASGKQHITGSAFLFLMGVLILMGFFAGLLTGFALAVWLVS